MQTISIEHASQEISRGLKSRYVELKQELQEVNALITETAKEFKEAAAQGDHSENAAYSEAQDKLTKLNTTKIYLLQNIESIEAITTDLKYVPKSYIDIYSTFRLRREDTGEIFTWRVYPGSISDVERGIMSPECSIYKSLAGREVGEVISTSNRISGTVVNFTVLEVY